LYASNILDEFQRGTVKTLANAEDKSEIVRRLSSIGPGSQRRWGKMTVAEMICHLSDAFRIVFNQKRAEPVSNWFSKSVMKWAALRLPSQWPHRVSTVPECAAGKGGTPPAEFERDLNMLRDLLERFSTLPSGFDYAEHPIFGKMTKAEWQRWGYLHMDHHLRQFGA
jgi:hypothetical protein